MTDNYPDLLNCGIFLRKFSLFIIFYIPFLVLSLLFLIRFFAGCFESNETDTRGWISRKNHYTSRTRNIGCAILVVKECFVIVAVVCFIFEAAAFCFFSSF